MKRIISNYLKALFIFAFIAFNFKAACLPKFSPEQIKILEKGDLLKLPISPKKSGGFIGGRSYILIKDDIDTCFKVVLDLKNYYIFYDDTLIETRIINKNKNKFLVKMVYGKGPIKMTYYADYIANPKNHSIKFTLNKNYPNDVKDARGYIKFSRYDEERVLMTNVTLVEFGNSIILKIFGNKIVNGMLKLPKYVKRFLATPEANKYRIAKKD